MNNSNAIYVAFASPRNKLSRSDSQCQLLPPLESNTANVHPHRSLLSYYSPSQTDGNPSSILHPVTNSFRSPRLEENYQLYCATKHLLRARILILCLIALHGLYIVLAQFIDKSHQHVRYESAWIHFGYTTLALPFVLMPTSWLDRRPELCFPTAMETLRCGDHRGVYHRNDCRGYCLCRCDSACQFGL